MIEVYKMVHGKYDPELQIPLNMKNQNEGRQTRGKYRLNKEGCQKKVRREFFRNRVTNLWNKLPDEVTDAPSINAFKNRLDKLWKPLNITYNSDNCLDYEHQIKNPNHAGVVPRQRINPDLDTGGESSLQPGATK